MLHSRSDSCQPIDNLHAKPWFWNTDDRLQYHFFVTDVAQSWALTGPNCIIWRLSHSPTYSSMVETGGQGAHRDYGSGGVPHYYLPTCTIQDLVCLWLELDDKLVCYCSFCTSRKYIFHIGCDQELNPRLGALKHSYVVRCCNHSAIETKLFSKAIKTVFVQAILTHLHIRCLRECFSWVVILRGWIKLKLNYCS